MDLDIEFSERLGIGDVVRFTWLLRSMIRVWEQRLGALEPDRALAVRQRCIDMVARRSADSGRFKRGHASDGRAKGAHSVCRWT